LIRLRRDSAERAVDVVMALPWWRRDASPRRSTRTLQQISCAQSMPVSMHHKP
jgi:hypothetical protein